MKSTSRAVGGLSVILTIFLAVSALGAQVPDSDSSSSSSSSSSIRSAGRHLLAKPAPKPTPKPAHKPVRGGPKSSDKSAPTMVALLASSSTTVQTSGKQGGTGTNSLKAVFKTTKGTAQGTVMTARGFAVNKAKQLTLTASKGKKVKGSIAVASKLSSSSSSHSHNLAMGLRLQKTSSGRHLSAVCDSVPILVTAYYTISCAEVNIVLTSVGLSKSTTCDKSIGDQIFIASVQYNVSSNSSESYALPSSFDGFSSIDIELLDASCGSLVVNNIDISVSAGVLSVTPIVKKWASSQIVVAVGNNTIDVRNKNSQSTFDLGGQFSKVVAGVHRYNSFDNNEQLIAVNLLVCKYSTSELANIAISSDGTHSVVDTFAIQDKTGTLVKPIKAVCSFYDATCLIQAYRSADDATLLLTFNVLDIVARSSSSLPIPTDSIILDGAVGGFAVADSNTIYYGSGNGITMIDSNSEEGVSASVSASANGSDAPAPAPGPMQPDSGIPFDNAVMCSDVVLDYKFTLKGSYNRLASLLYTTIVACGPEVVEYSNGVITERRGTSLTADGSNWRSVIDIDYSLGVVYNNIRADYIAVTTGGSVAAFKLGSINEPSMLYNVTLTAGSAGIAVIELPASN